MSKIKIVLASCLTLICFQALAQKELTDVERAAAQLKYALEEIAKAKAPNGELVAPRTVKEANLVMVSPNDWTSGFFAGNLWYMYDLTKDSFWLQKAQAFTTPLESEKTDSTTHDLGFKMYCSFGNGYRLTQNPRYKEVLIESARTLTTRFNEKIGSIKSWDHQEKRWSFPVIIDNMMNLELLFWAFKETKDSLFYKIAIAHANTTIKNHFRADNSSFHVVDYDPNTGRVIKKNTHQGFSDSSAWSRGQSWGLYGFTMCYRETRKPEYLRQAERIAQFILHHPNLPSDLVPYWDFNAPDIPNALLISVGLEDCCPIPSRGITASITISAEVFPARYPILAKPKQLKCCEFLLGVFDGFCCI